MKTIPFYQKWRAIFRKWRYPGSLKYWEQRYASGGDSGAGSRGVLAAYKAGGVNEFVKNRNIETVLELGCGDGQQLLLAQYPQYTGLDIAPSALSACRRLHGGDNNKRFSLYVPSSFNPVEYSADMALSMEVIFHLTEEESYQRYMKHLFACARKWMVVFASNSADETGGMFPHFKPRQFLPDVPEGWQLRRQLPNPHADISISEFFFFEKNT